MPESGVCSCIQSNVTHVRGVENELFHILCTALYEQKIKGYVKGVERDSKYIIMSVMIAIVKGVKRSSKYTVRTVMLCMSKMSNETQDTL